MGATKSRESGDELNRLMFVRDFAMREKPSLCSLLLELRKILGLMRRSLGSTESLSLYPTIKIRAIRWLQVQIGFGCDQHGNRRENGATEAGEAAIISLQLFAQDRDLGSR
jgi:hypothetical protein